MWDAIARALNGRTCACRGHDTRAGGCKGWTGLAVRGWRHGEKKVSVLHAILLNVELMGNMVIPRR
jgi:hypothetical protein